MLTPALRFADRMPEDTRAQLRPYLEPWLWIVPRWCEEVWVRFTDCHDTALAECDVRRDYRFATVTLGPDFLGALTVRERHETVLHELLHIHHATLNEVFGDLIDTYVTDGKQRDMLIVQKKRAIEMMIVDLTTSVVAHEREPR